MSEDATRDTSTGGTAGRPGPRRAVEIIPYLFCRDVEAEVEWLVKAFGFERRLLLQAPSGGTHAEIALEGQVVMLGTALAEFGLASPAETGRRHSGVFVYLDDVDAHAARAKAMKADIVRDLEDAPYGRTYWARDPEGHDWFFTTPPDGQ